MKSTVIRIRPQKSSISRIAHVPRSALGAATFSGDANNPISTPQPMPCVSPIVTIIRKMPCSMCIAVVPFAQIVRTLERLLPPTDFAAFARTSLVFNPPSAAITADLYVSKGAGSGACTR